MRGRFSLVALAGLCLVFAPARAAHADAVLLMAAPYGRGAGFNPTGHVGVYLTRVCAETLTRLRPCVEGEHGAVLSRYNKVGPFDWAAIPILPYLYGVTRADDVPSRVSPEVVERLRTGYRQEHLQTAFPDEVAERNGRWRQLIGAAYDRELVAISVRTTPEQDQALIEAFNAGENAARFNALFRNCADFARDVINRHYYPGALRSSVFADLGVTTPKQVARTLTRYGQRHPETGLAVFLIAQVPGNRAPSPRTRGVLESLLRVKKFAIPLAVVQPWVPVGLAAGYLVTGRFNPHRLATHALDPADLPRVPGAGATPAPVMTVAGDAADDDVTTPLDDDH